ncbi:MAG: DUF4352 domain-containing protein [Chloroflexota bacterium]
MDENWAAEANKPSQTSGRHRGRWLLTLFLVLLFVGLGVYTFAGADLAERAAGLLAANNPAVAVRDAIATLVPTPKPGTLLAAAGVVPTTTPTPAAAQVLVVANTDGDGVALRKAPGSTERLSAWPEGAKLTVVGADQQAAGITWRHVRDASGNVGWVPAQYAAPVSGGGAPVPAPTGTPAGRAALQTANRTLLIGEVQFVMQVGSSKPEQGGEFAVVSVTLRNVGEQRVLYAPADFWLQNSQGNITNAKVVTGITNPLELGQLAPNGWVSGRLVFEVPKGDRDLVLIWSPCPESCQERQIELP